MRLRPHSKQPHRSILVTILLLFALTPLGAQQNQLEISSTDQIKAEFDSVPCKDDDRLRAVKALFEKMGAPASDISIENHKDVENLVVRKQGNSRETIVIGAHYDKAPPEGCGAVDNWSGIVAIAHLYRTVKTAPLKKSVLFVAFGKEERGLVGSRAMAAAITNDQLTQYCEMINIDSLGLTAPQALDNISSNKLLTFTADLAKQMEMPFAHAPIVGADSDSTPFLRRGIPALTIHGLSTEWRAILHSKNDQATKVNHISVYLGYRLALALMLRLDELSCGQFK